MVPSVHEVRNGRRTRAVQVMLSDDELWAVDKFREGSRAAYLRAAALRRIGEDKARMARRRARGG